MPVVISFFSHSVFYAVKRLRTRCVGGSMQIFVERMTDWVRNDVNGNSVHAINFSVVNCLVSALLCRIPQFVRLPFFFLLVNVNHTARDDLLESMAGCCCCCCWDWWGCDGSCEGDDESTEVSSAATLADEPWTWWTGNLLDLSPPCIRQTTQTAETDHRGPIARGEGVVDPCRGQDRRGSR